MSEFTIAFPQLFANGLIAGAIYALVAVGFTMIYATNRFAHFAHGVVVTVGAYIGYQLFALWGIPFPLTVLLTILLTGLLGVVLYKIVYEPLLKKKSTSVILLIAGIAMMIILENLMIILFGADQKALGLIEVTQGMNILGASVTTLQIVIVALVAVLLVLVWLFVKKTKLGILMRAVSDNAGLAGITGINTKKIQMLSFFLASLIAGCAAILIALEQNIEAAMGTNLIIKGFTASVIGGVTSMPGSILGSVILGMTENYGVWFIQAGYKKAIAFSLLLIFLLFLPQGLMGIKKGTRQ